MGPVRVRVVVMVEEQKKMEEANLIFLEIQHLYIHFIIRDIATTQELHAVGGGNH